MAGSRIGRTRIGRAARLGGAAAEYAARTVTARRGSEEELRARHRETAKRMVKVLGGMRGAAMKVGQTFSVVDVGLVPEDFREEFQRTLAELQQNAQATPFKDMRKVIERDIGETLSAAFADFDEEPIAAASIGQVYRATLRDGRAVAVKVQYPAIKDAVRADMKNLGLLLKLVSVVAPGMDTREIADELRERIAEELDYELEASNQRALARAYRGHPFIVVPDVVPDLCRERVIVSEFVDGARFEAVLDAPQAERDRWAEIVVRFYINGPLRHRLLNGDPHPGNALFCPDGRVGFIDFGFFKRLSPEEVRAQIGTMRAVHHDDALELLEVIASTGAIPRDERLAEPLFESYRSIFGWSIADEVVEVTGERTRRMMDDYRRMRREGFDELQLPADHVVLMRAVILLVGILGQLRAARNWFEIGQEWLLDAPAVTALGRAEAAWRADAER
jgi:predicted unusual protein kinase regulating ubiquinone biosynthesis (AarF/ABC1/UbiB family)